MPELTSPGLAHESDAPRPLEGIHLLVADDSDDTLRVICFIIRAAGGTFEAVGNGQQAVDAARTAAREGRPFNAILMDIQMPVMDGCEAARVLRQDGLVCPIIALTANDQPEQIRACMDAGCDAYEAKPIRRGSLVKSIAHWMTNNPRSASRNGLATDQ